MLRHRGPSHGFYRRISQTFRVQTVAEPLGQSPSQTLAAEIRPGPHRRASASSRRSYCGCARHGVKDAEGSAADWNVSGTCNAGFQPARVHDTPTGKSAVPVPVAALAGWARKRWPTDLDLESIRLPPLPISPIKMQDFSEHAAGGDPLDAPTGRPGPEPLFLTTLWSVVLRVGSPSESESAAALENLCHQYWQPLYVFARRRGYGQHDAQDVTQGFLAELLARNSLLRAEPARGRFRTFLLSAFCNYLANQRRGQNAGKRGGGQFLESLDDEAAEELVGQLSDGLTPELHYERSWALALLERVLERLREEYAAAGRQALFAALQPHLTGAAGPPGYAALGRQLDLSEGTVSVAMHRMRRRYGEFLREEIAATVASAEEAEAELRHLLQIVSTVPPAH